MVKEADRFERRAKRTRFSLKKQGKGRLRLSVHRSGRHIYGQVIDDEHGRTLAAASTLDKGLRANLKTGADREALERHRRNGKRLLELPPFIDLEEWSDPPTATPRGAGIVRLLTVAMMRHGASK